jgi:hypothetical protein
MHALALLVATASLGIDYGWQPTDDGQLEYIIQIEPSLVKLLAQGQEIVSEIHPDAKNVRRFRIFVGKGDLPRIDLPEPEPAEEPEPGPPIPFRRGNARDVARTEFQPEMEPAPAALEPLEFAPPARRGFGGEFRAPDDPPGEPQVGPLEAEAAEPEASFEPRKHRPVGYAERLNSRADRDSTTLVETEPTAEQAPLPVATEPARPWLPLFVTLVLLFGSVGGNAYLGWLAKDFYGRYRAVAAELREPRAVEG